MEFVYVLRLGRNSTAYKIGRTANIVQRMKGYRQMLGQDAWPEHLIATNDSKRLEKELHAKYRPSRMPAKRGRGYGNPASEWFFLTQDDLEELKSIQEVTYG